MAISHKIIDGKKQAKFVLDELRTRVIRLKELGWQPRLVSIDIGDSPAVSLYITNQQRACDQVGIDFEHRHYPGSVTQGEFVIMLLVI
jgi:methylenetetrahydrofolate dehydrogenase (NADP+)/methenyltetrahydrofolate cyclohydrolase